MAGLSLRHVTKSYGDSTAISDFNLEVEEKEFIVLTGPSGSGKSTLLRMISGTENITQGELKIDDLPTNDIPPSERQVALISKCYALFPNFNVFENMAYGLKIRNTSVEEIKSRVEEAAGILEITQLLERRPKTLSAGQQLRVTLGRALARKPKILLLDEPFSELEPKLRAQMTALLLSLHKAFGIVFIYTTGDEAEALSIGKRTVLIREGALQQIDTAENLYNKPVNLFAAGFGSPRMNFIEAQLRQEDGQVAACFGKSLYKVALPPAKQLAVSAYIGKEVIAGVRPESIALEQSGDLLEMEAEFSETVGADTYLTLNFEGQQLTALIGSHAGIKSGSKVHAAFRSEKLFFFDKRTGKTIAF